MSKLPLLDLYHRYDADRMLLRALDKMPSRAVGGILADVMGLGKTLSILSAVLSSKPSSVAYQASMESESLRETGSIPILGSRATLVVVTSVRKWKIGQAE